MLKWTELAHDFYQQGFDVLLFDHRGQGYSERLIIGSDRGHLDEFRFYAADMAKIIDKAVQSRHYQQQYLLAHSLGALISTYYLADFEHRINKAVLSSPFFGVPLKSPLRDELLIGLMIAARASLCIRQGRISTSTLGQQRTQPLSNPYEMDESN